MKYPKRNRLKPEFVRETRLDLGLSAAQAARLVGIKHASNWFRWEKNGVGGPTAILILALRESAAVRRYFGLPNPSKTNK